MPPVSFPGRIARYFLTSKLTPAIVAAICAWGLLAIFFTPREENPQITMPSATIVTQYPGASSAEVQKLVTERGERVLQEIPGIEHIYTISSQNLSIMTVLFHVGDDPTKSFVNLYDQVFAHLNELPPGASQPQITPLSVDDVPIVVLTLHGRNYNRGQLYQAAQRLIDAVRPIDGVSTVAEYGGRPREVNVTLDPVRLAAYGLSPPAIAQALGATNLTQTVGSVRDASSELNVHAGTAYTTADQVAAQIVGVSDGQPVALRQVARVELGWAPEESQTQFAYGAAARARSADPEPAVDVAIAKKAGSNAVTISDSILRAIESVELPPGVEVSVTRNYGDKANRAVNELIERLMEAIVIVVILLLVLGWREALVVATAIPLTLFVTLGVGMLTGQTINRITLFALILSLGLLVDDAIVTVENIHRHFHADPKAPRAEAAVRAVAEIGRPTTLATLTVILSFLPMLFVTGMMGPYMRPIPLNVPVAMLASLGIAFAITPWVTYKLLRDRELKPGKHAIPRWVAPFRNALQSLLERPRRGSIFLALLLLAFLASAALPVLTLVQFRMLPDANETTFLVSIDAPPASPVANTTRIADAVGAELAKVPEIKDYETFVGTSSIPDLASLLQGTIFRNAPNQADIRVNLTNKEDRHVQSADLVRELRPRLVAAAARYGATLRILQTPPGPPVRDTILAKIYGPDPEVRRGIASFLIDRMQRERGVVDVYPSDKALPAALQLEVDQREASLAGTDAAAIAGVLAMSLQGAAVSTLHTADDPRPVGIFLRFAPQYRSDAAALASIQIPTRSGGMVPLSAVTHLVAAQAQAPLYRDDFENVTYVGADMAGRSSTYAVIGMLFALAGHPLPAGYRVDWGGEWHLTNTVFADLGRAMGVAFLLIYFVLVARFRSFTIPLVVLAAVPLAVIGVMPGFALLAPFGVYFSATAMIGLIALVGIVVRNSIILIEFIEDKRKEGSGPHEALIEAATTRTRPIFLTAAAGVLSSIVIASDPVWSGLAWALVFGMTASAVLSVLAIPLLYERVVRKAASASGVPHGGPPDGEALPAVPGGTARPGVPATLLAIAALAIALSTTPAAAQTASPGPSASASPPATAPATMPSPGASPAPLSLDAALALALAHDPPYRQAHAAVDAAQARVRGAIAPLIPSLQVRDAFLYADPVARLATPFGPLPFSSTTTTNVPLLALQYQLYDGGLSAARVAQAAAELSAARAAEREARGALIDSTTKAYFDLVAALELQGVANRAVDVASGHLTQARQLFAGGQIPRADVLRAQTELANEQVNAIAAGNAVALAQSDLDNVLDVPLSDVYMPTDRLDADAPSFDLDSLLNEAHERRGELQAARAALSAAQHAVDQARAGGTPQLALTVADGNTQPAVTTGYHNQFSVGLNAVFSLYDGGASAAAMAAAKAGVEEAELGLEALANSVALQVRKDYLNLNEARARVAAAREYVAFADENLRLAQIRYRGGVGTALELQDAELRSTAARQTLVGAQAALREGVTALRFAAGLL
jgi:multidrug efflux pump subunit AcrB/outer membrane protein TolC